VATSEKTKKEDQRLKDELKSADIGKFKKLLRLAIAPPKRPVKTKSK